MVGFGNAIVMRTEDIRRQCYCENEGYSRAMLGLESKRRVGAMSVEAGFILSEAKCEARMVASSKAHQWFWLVWTGVLLWRHPGRCSVSLRQTTGSVYACQGECEWPLF